MQIIFKTHYPNIEGSFVYDRTSKESASIDEILIEVAKNLSENISAEPKEIKINPNVVLSDFLPPKYHSKKTIKLNFNKLNNSSDFSKIFYITVHFNIVDSQFIGKRIKAEQIFYLNDNVFDLLDTLITA